MNKPHETIREIVVRIDERVIAIQTNIVKVFAHLERLNNQENRQNVAIAKNSVRIGLMWKIGGGILVLLGSGIAILVKALGIY